MINFVTTSWDFAGGIPDDKQFDMAQAEAKKAVLQFGKLLDEDTTWATDSSRLLLILDKLSALNEKYGSGFKEQFYVYLASRLDGAEPRYKAMLKRSEELDIERAAIMRRFTHTLARTTAPQQSKLLADPALKQYRYFMKTWFMEAPHLLSDQAEEVVNRLSDSAIGSWVRLIEERLSLQEVPFKTGDKPATVNFEQLISLMSDTDSALASRAAKSFNTILHDNLPLVEAEMNAVLSYKKAQDELRGYKYPDQARLEGDEIDRRTVHSLIEAVSSAQELSQRYYALKARLLGKDKLHYHERNTPVLIGGAKQKTYNYEKAFAMVNDAFSRLTPLFSDILKSYHENNQVDVYPKTGKRGGAFMASYAPTIPGYVMLNHTNKLDDVSTLAHEFGHAIHFELAKKAQNPLLYESTMATAEVASTFMEDFILDDIVAGADDATKLSIIMERLNRDVSSIFRQIAFYRFELNLHDKYRRAGYLSAGEIGSLFRTEMESYMGPAVSQDAGSENWWTYVGHFRRFFYVYSYAGGLLISKALQRRVRADKDSISDVIKVFEAGGSMTAEDIFASVGIDIRQKKFWTGGLQEISDQLTAAEKLAGVLL